MIRRFSKLSLVVLSAFFLLAGATALAPDTALAAVGDNSCGASFTEPCDDNTGDIGDDSCNGDHACIDNSGVVGNRSCNEELACYKNGGSVGNDSCNVSVACYLNFGTIGNDSCNRDQACLLNGGDVGDDSCNEELACYLNVGTIGNDSCNGDGACYGNSGAIGNHSCNTSGPFYDQCQGSHASVGDCQYNDVDKIPAACLRTECSTEAFELPDAGPGFDFADACAAHTECSELATSLGDRRACDRQLLADLQDACTEMWPGGRWSAPPQRRACLNLANAYYNALKLPGGSRGGAWS